MSHITGVDRGVGYGVYGRSMTTVGVSGDSPSGYGVYGRSVSGDGVYGRSVSGIGVSGDSLSFIGVSGRSDSGIGVSGDSLSFIGVSGKSGSFIGVYGRSDSFLGGGVLGESDKGFGVSGLSSIGSGVYGESDYGSGVSGKSSIGTGVSGESNSNWGVSGKSNSNYGVNGYSGTSYGVRGESDGDYGVYALSRTSYGLYATSFNDLAAFLEGNVKIEGSNLEITGKKLAGQAMNADVGIKGNVRITGNLTVDGISKSGGQFKIDHPLDPANKYLSHSFVESPDMKNVYDGVVVLDDKGEADIELPDWFGALNKDFRYQLTAIGAPAPNLHISEEISSDGVTTNYYYNSNSSSDNNNSRFKVAGGTSGMKVSWQVTGIRKDPWANAHRIPVEEDKPAKERGYYTYPELYGQPEERGISGLLFPRDEEEKEKDNVLTNQNITM